MLVTKLRVTLCLYKSRVESDKLKNVRITKVIVAEPKQLSLHIDLFIDAPTSYLRCLEYRYQYIVL